MNGLEVRISEIPGAGWGVFTVDPITPGDLIEICPASCFSWTFDESSVISHWAWFEVPEVPDGRAVVMWGYGNLYNHSFEPNMKAHVKVFEPSECEDTDVLNSLLQASTENWSPARVTFEASRDVSPQEELVCNYGYETWKPEWYLNLEKQLD